MELEIQIYNLGFPGKALFSIKMTFEDVFAAVKLAKSLIEDGQGFNIIERS